MDPKTLLESVPFRIILMILATGFMAVVFTWVWVIIQMATGRRLLPEGIPKAVPWGIGSVLLAFLIRVGAEFPVAAVYRSMVPGAHVAAHAEAKQPEAGKLPALKLPPKHTLWIISLVNGASILLIPLALRATSRATLDDVGIPARPAAIDALRAIVTYFFIIPFIYGTFFLAIIVWHVVLKHPRNPHPVETALLKEPWPVLSLAFVSAVVLAPIAEEILFRGVLLGWLTRVCNRLRKPRPKFFHDDPSFSNPSEAEWVGAAPPVPRLDEFHEFADRPAAKPHPAWIIPNILTSLVFAGVHFPQWPAPVPIFFLSLGLGVLYQRTGKLTAPIVLHATFNGVSTFLMFLVVLSGIPLNPDTKRFEAVPPPAVKKSESPVSKLDRGKRTPGPPIRSGAKD
jgi:membrane protease YdiL (CAAX protease family)